jgi:putative membrane protein
MNRNAKIGWIIIGIALVILIVVPAVMGGFSPGWQGWGMMGPGMMGGYGFHNGYGWSWIMGIVMIVFWALIIAGVVILIRHAASGHRWTGSGTQESALDILKRRYAQGEIGKEEFEQKKKDLL